MWNQPNFLYKEVHQKNYNSGIKKDYLIGGINPTYSVSVVMAGGYLTKFSSLYEYDLDGNLQELNLTVDFTHLQGTNMDHVLAVNRDDEALVTKNRLEGIALYIDTQNKLLGKIYMTPRGPYSVLKQVELDFDMYRKTILQRFKSKRPNLAEWYVIEGNTELQVDETCKFCDEVDDFLFERDCWMTKIGHEHGTPIENNDIIEYLFKGRHHRVLFKDLDKSLPHVYVSENVKAFIDGVKIDGLFM